ncbi:MAG: hypothetical protein AB9M60_22245 [Leptothrix sp. (in: b-proteobacteria)]
MKTVRPARPARPAVTSRHALALLLTGWLATGLTPPAHAADGTAADLLHRIRTEIGQPRCDDTAQCRTLPIGQKACGGPEAYLPWSTRVSDADRLQALAQQHSEARQAQNQARGLMSNCSVTPDPGAVCQRHRCVLNRAPAAGANPGPLLIQ